MGVDSSLHLPLLAFDLLFMESSSVTPKDEEKRPLEIVPKDGAKRSRHTHAEDLDAGTYDLGKYRKHWREPTSNFIISI